MRKTRWYLLVLLFQIKSNAYFSAPSPLFLARRSQSVAHRSSISLVLLDGTSLQQKQFLTRPYHMLFKPSGCCNIQSQNTSRPARRATARGTVTWGLYGFQFFSRIMSNHCDGYFQSLGDSKNQNACSFFFCTASQTAAPYPPCF